MNKPTTLTSIAAHAHQKHAGTVQQRNKLDHARVQGALATAGPRKPAWWKKKKV